jgi:hypothetical protein
VRWAARDAIPVQVGGPAYLVSNVVEQPEKRRMMLHLVNYNAKKVAALDPVQISCRLPQGQTAKEVRIYSPDMDESRTVEMKNGASEVTFAAPVKTYTIAVVTW